MKIGYPEIGVCGLSCRLCPTYHSNAPSRCGGCKSEERMRTGCPFITCAVKKKEIEFCWQRPGHGQCEKWAGQRNRGKSRDSFVSYQRLESNIAFITQHGLQAFAADQREREHLLSAMLAEFNEGRSKTLYCVAATVMEIVEIREAIMEARAESASEDFKDRAKVLHSIFERIAEKRMYILKLRR
jgi:hypothetical protein